MSPCDRRSPGERQFLCWRVRRPAFGALHARGGVRARATRRLLLSSRQEREERCPVSMDERRPTHPPPLPEHRGVVLDGIPRARRAPPPPPAPLISLPAPVAQLT